MHAVCVQLSGRGSTDGYGFHSVNPSQLERHKIRQRELQCVTVEHTDRQTDRRETSPSHNGGVRGGSPGQTRRQRATLPSDSWKVKASFSSFLDLPFSSLCIG